MIMKERPHDASAGPVWSRVSREANVFIHEHFWLSVHFPALAPGTPCCALLFLGKHCSTQPCHKDSFSVRWAGTPPKLLNPTKSHPFLVHFAGPRQNSVLVTTRCYLPEIPSLGVTLLPYDMFSNMEHVR
jgi:hypothetical protein